MESRFERQLKKGVLEMLVLTLVCEKSTYGYELILQLAKQGGEMLRLKEGTLYPILYRLEDDGLIIARWQQGEGRTTPKKYYEATKAGRTELTRQRATWNELSACVGRICGEEKT